MVEVTARHDDDDALHDFSGQSLAGRYTLIERVGVGSMGQVYRGVHTLMRKPVAIKLLHPDLSGEPEVARRFQREAQAAANINHPHVCAATDFGVTDDGLLFLVMEFLDGQTLGQLIDDLHLLPARRAVAIARQVTLALDHIHAAGVVHRDLKPDNVFLVDWQGDPDHVKLLDFGIARVQPRLNSSTLTRAGQIVGTPLYMSPQQALGERVDHRADLYALGAMLFHMLGGRPPFVHHSLMKLVSMHISRPPPALSHVALQPIPPALDALVASLLLKEPDERPPTAAAVLDALDALDLASLPDTVDLDPDALASTHAPASARNTPDPHGEHTVLLDHQRDASAPPDATPTPTASATPTARDTPDVAAPPGARDTPDAAAPPDASATPFAALPPRDVNTFLDIRIDPGRAAAALTDPDAPDPVLLADPDAPPPRHPSGPHTPPPPSADALTPALLHTDEHPLKPPPGLLARLRTLPPRQRIIALAVATLSALTLAAVLLVVLL